MPMASRKPLQEHRAQEGEEDEGDRHRMVEPVRGTNGFSTMWAVASAAESVMVMMKSVRAKPSSTSTNDLAPPAREQLLEHEDAALAVRAVRGDLA